MELKQAYRKSWTLTAAEVIWHRKTMCFCSVLLFILLAFAFGVYVDRSGFLGRTLIPFLKENTVLMPKRIRATLLKPEIEHITLDIKHDDFMKLAYQREIALAREILLPGEKDFVSATIRHNDETIKVKIRLKGDWTDHLRGDKWSFRIKVKGDNTFFGMKEFSIHHPQARNYIYEWLFHQTLKREGVLSLRYQFIDVTLNGKDLGIYALEEHLDKRLIEHNQLREGPIVRFNENLHWLERYQQYRPFPEAEINGSGSYLSSDIDAFQTNIILSEPSSYAQYLKAIYLLESVRRGELKRSDVFDVQKFARYFAIADLMGAQHTIFWSNIRFYYNPITSRLEPIGFDGNGGTPITELSGRVSDHGITSIETVFSDPIFFEEYVKALERISERSYLDTLLAELNDEIEQNLNIIHSEFPEFNFSTKVLYQNQTYIRTVLNPIKGLHAYYYQASKDYIEFELGNIQAMPIEVLGVSYKDSLVFQPVQKTILPAKFPLDLVNYQRARFTFPKDFVWSDEVIKDLKVDYRLLGTSRVRQETVFPWSYLDDDFVKNDFIRQEPNVHTFDFLVMDEASQVIFIKPGRWNLDRSLIIPKGYRVIAGEDTQLDLSNAATILSYSPLELIGSEDYPIVIQSTDSTGQGFVVINAEQPSILQYIIFDNLANPSHNGWELTGAVTFYESPVRISHTQFVGNRSEDGINIVRSDFTIDKTLFSEASSDAFDADFTKGEIKNSSFVASGNDAIDASGSVIDIQDVFINGAGDKGLSTGENSQVTVTNIEIKNAEIAVASKDISDLTIYNLEISGGEIGFAAYQKKPEFGPASITVDGLEMSGVPIPYLVEPQSKVVVDSVVIEPNREHVEEILYGVEYGKSSD
jgi:hypothetical protein